MSKKTEEIKRIKTEPSGSCEIHPAFGQASFHRVQGNPGKLYGSNLEDHHTFIDLEIKTSERHHNLARDWYFASDPIVRVTFSAAQFAELLTTMNMGGGIPCTLNYVTPDGGGIIPKIPLDQETEAERIEEEFKAKLADNVRDLKENEEKVNEILEKKIIGKKYRATIKNLMYESYRFFVDSAPFAVQSLVEAKEKVIVSAKAEIDAFLTNVVQRVGLEAITEQSKLLKGKRNDKARKIL